MLEKPASQFDHYRKAANIFIVYSIKYFLFILYIKMHNIKPQNKIYLRGKVGSCVFSFLTTS